MLLRYIDVSLIHLDEIPNTFICNTLCCLPTSIQAASKCSSWPPFHSTLSHPSPGGTESCARAFLHHLKLAKSFFGTRSCIALGQMIGIFFGSLEFSVPHQKVFQTVTRWWFQMFFIFTPTWGNIPIWSIFEREGWNHQLNFSPFFCTRNMIDIKKGRKSVFGRSGSCCEGLLKRRCNTKKGLWASISHTLSGWSLTKSYNLLRVLWINIFFQQNQVNKEIGKNWLLQFWILV